MTQDFQFLRRIYNVFDPFRPLPTGDPAYVDCREVRGDGDILVEIGKEILYSDRMTSQLYVGHRGYSSKKYSCFAIGRCKRSPSFSQSSQQRILEVRSPTNRSIKKVT
jgi:hypothetical protein